MKVLWFTNTPCGASEKLLVNLKGAGWLTSLEIQLKQIPGIELFISFYWGEDIEPFEYSGTTYIPLYRKNDGTKLGRYFNRLFRLYNDDEDLGRMVQTVQNVNPDIIHVHGTESNFGLIQKNTLIPVVISIQGILLPCYEKFFAGVPREIAVQHEAATARVLIRSISYTQKNLLLSAKREQRILAETRYIIGRTDWDRRITGLLAKKSVYFHGDEILRSVFYRDSAWNKQHFDKPFRLVTVMSAAIYKGLETLVKTAKILKEYEDLDFTWEVIGPKESDDLPKMIKSWLKIDFRKLNITLAGSKNENEIVDTLLESDLFCQLSHIENSSNSLCEAMAIGIPVITSFAGGTDTMLTHGTEGILVQSGDPYSLAGSIIEVSKDFAGSAKRATNARQTALRRHNKVSIADSLNETYHKILATKPA